MITVRAATPNDKDSWNDFIANHTIDNHAFNWHWQDIISKTFGHQPYYLIATNDKKITGILPLFVVKSFLFGKSHISVPYLNGGGVIADDISSTNALVEHAINLSSSTHSKYLELRFRHQLTENPFNLVARSHKVSMKLNLESDPDQVFNSFTSKLRSQIKRPTKEGAEVAIFKGSNPTALNDFYSVFSRNMRDLGTPVYSKKLFELCQKYFNQKASTIIVYKNNSPVAAGITILEQQTVEILWGSSLRSENSYSPNMLMYWEAIKNACLEGAHYFDFGRASLNSGTYKFKEQWGSVPSQLNWYYYSKSGNIPDINPKSKNFSLLVNLWQKLPLNLTTTLGPWITKALP